jgi:hypothetical protein
VAAGPLLAAPDRVVQVQLSGNVTSLFAVSGAPAHARRLAALDWLVHHERRRGHCAVRTKSMSSLVIGGVLLEQVGSAFVWSSGLSIDADGAATAYAPAGSGLPALDELANAGYPGNWWGIVTDNGRSEGTPIIQGATDPAPGFYVSTTALVDPTRPVSDPRRYVDSFSLPYLSIPPEFRTAGAHLGDVAMVVNRRNGLQCPAVVADVGPRRELGEGSIALASALGLDSSPRHGGISSGIACVLFYGSRKGWPRSNADLSVQSVTLFSAWGGTDRLNSAIA